MIIFDTVLNKIIDKEPSMNKPCCDDMKNANQRRTDNEGYGCAIWLEKGEYTIGSLPPIRFCPWCGFDFKQSNKGHNNSL